MASDDPNFHITEYLNFYCDPQNECTFAILLNGPWGSGKTRYVEKYKEKRENAVPDSKTLYVTLNGVSSTDQIDDQLFTQLHPIIGSQGARVLGAVAKHFLKGALRFNIDEAKDEIMINVSAPNINISKYTVRPNNTVIIFDDLERCPMNLQEVLGYINRFVEHENLKVIIVANEAELLKGGDADKYKNIKEKIVGKTFIVQQNTDEALKVFTEKLSCARSQNFFFNAKQLLKDLYLESETNNLRILKQSIMEADRVVECLEEQHWQHEEVIRSIASEILAIAFEIRAGRITEEQVDSINNRQPGAYLLGTRGGLADIIGSLKVRYPDLFEQQLYLSGPLVRQILFDGLIDKRKIMAEINEQPPFRKIGSEPAWKRIAALWEINEEEFAKATEEVTDDFNARVFIEAGLMFQIFGIRLLLSQMSVINKSSEQIIEECKIYIDDIAKTGKIRLKYSNPSEGNLGTGWDGFMYASADSAAFSQIIDYYRTTVDKVSEEALPLLALALLELTKSDTIKFYRQLCVNNVENSTYYHVPILAHIEPSKFVDVVLTLSPRAQNVVMSVFAARYQPSDWQSQLKIEKNWLIEVKNEFEHRLGHLGPLSKYRLTNMINRYLVPALPDDVAETVE